MVICMVDMIVWYRTLPKEPLPILKAVPVLIKIPWELGYIIMAAAHLSTEINS